MSDLYTQAADAYLRTMNTNQSMVELRAALSERMTTGDALPDRVLQLVFIAGYRAAILDELSPDLRDEHGKPVDAEGLVHAFKRTWGQEVFEPVPKK